MTILKPTQPFVAVDEDGVKHRFSPSTLVAEDHWVVAGREALFNPAETAAEATAAATTGTTRRTAARPTKRAPRKAAAAKKTAAS